MRINAKAAKVNVELVNEENETLFRMHYDNLDYSVDVGKIIEAIPALVQKVEEMKNFGTAAGK